MTNEHNTRVQWFGWFGWFPDKLEAWLEAQAAQGWELVKADRLLNRFHFVRSGPKTVRVFADFPKTDDAEYKTIFEDAGWTLVDNGLGWYIWRAEYTERRPEAVNDSQPLIERNTRLLFILIGALVALLMQVPIQMGLRHVTQAIYDSIGGKILVVVWALLAVVLAASIVLTLVQIRKLKQGKR